jgi:hypothetical protein
MRRRTVTNTPYFALCELRHTICRIIGGRFQKKKNVTGAHL